MNIKERVKKILDEECLADAVRKPNGDVAYCPICRKARRRLAHA